MMKTFVAMGRQTPRIRMARQWADVEDASRAAEDRFGGKLPGGNLPAIGSWLGDPVRAVGLIPNFIDRTTRDTR